MQLRWYWSAAMMATSQKSRALNKTWQLTICWLCCPVQDKEQSLYNLSYKKLVLFFKPYSLLWDFTQQNYMQYLADNYQGVCWVWPNSAINHYFLLFNLESIDALGYTTAQLNTCLLIYFLQSWSLFKTKLDDQPHHLNWNNVGVYWLGQWLLPYKNKK